MAFLQIAELESVGPPRFQFENLFRKFYFNIKSKFNYLFNEILKFNFKSIRDVDSN